MDRAADVPRYPARRSPALRRSNLRVTGLIRGKPDPWLEHKLREKFTEFDRELRRILPRLYRHDSAG
jgi:hypothetical protein